MEIDKDFRKIIVLIYEEEESKLQEQLMGAESC